MPTVKEVREIARKPGVEAYARYVLQKISIYITWFLLKTPLTPNQVSLIGLLSGVAAIVCFAQGKGVGLLLGAFFAQLMMVLDAVDGEVARYRKITGLEGHFLDAVGYHLMTTFLFIGITIGVHQRSSSNSLTILLGFGAVIGYLVDTYSYKLLIAWIAFSNYQNRGSIEIQNSVLYELSVQESDGMVYSALRKFRALTKNLFFLLRSGHAVTNIICLAAILDFAWPKLSLMGESLSFLYLVLVFYGVASPLFVVGSFGLTLQDRRVSKQFWEICKYVTSKGAMSDDYE
jgi:phosphatidylglycerophosphate synthase